jgi:heme-degrading monooxygenase HmoA
VNNMVFARMSIWTFKGGKREEGFLLLDSLLNSSTRHVQGFRGYMSLLSEDPSSAVSLTLWQDEESLQASEKGVFADTTRRVLEYLDKPPTSSNYRVYSTELFQRIEKINI